MKYVSEFRQASAVKHLIDDIHDITTKQWAIMEICGGQTHAILKSGIDEMLPDKITLLHGPGCPVCVTPLEKIDQAIQIAASDDVIFCSFGDMLRVPGSVKDLLSVRAEGGDIRIVYSPLDALRIAAAHPAKKVVFFAIGFETTAPAVALTILRAKQEKVKNFFVLVSHVLVPPAIETILASPTNRVQGFLAAGHVCTVMGYEEYIPIAKKYRIPIVVTGFEPFDLVKGIYACLKQLEEKQYFVDNQYARSVHREGNRSARAFIDRVFDVVHQKWRGIGEIPDSGLALRREFSDLDAEIEFCVQDKHVDEPEGCMSGLVLQGVKKPDECPSFATICTPEHPLGATMVSSEGACAAYFRYKQFSDNP